MYLSFGLDHPEDHSRLFLGAAVRIWRRDFPRLLKSEEYQLAVPVRFEHVRRPPGRHPKVPSLDDPIQFDDQVRIVAAGANSLSSQSATDNMLDYNVLTSSWFRASLYFTHKGTGNQVFTIGQAFCDSTRYAPAIALKADNQPVLYHGQPFELMLGDTFRKVVRPSSERYLQIEGLSDHPKSNHPKRWFLWSMHDRHQLERPIPHGFITARDLRQSSSQCTFRAEQSFTRIGLLSLRFAFSALSPDFQFMTP